MSEIFESYDGTIKPPIEPQYMSEHADHCIEAQHHGENEYYPRRIPEKFEAIEGFFPKQDVMLLNVESKIKKSLVLEFTYTSEKISREVSESDLVRVFFINETGLTELIGKIYTINYQYNTIVLDYSENYSSKRVEIAVTNLRFISNDLDEVPPFISKLKESITPFYIDPKDDPPRIAPMRWMQHNGYPYFEGEAIVFEPILYTKPIIPIAPLLTTT